MAKGEKTGGRKPGTPNKVTKDLRERINDFLNDNWEQIETDFAGLEPDKRVLLFERLLQFAVPKLKTVQNIGIDENKMTLHRIVFEDFSKMDDTPPIEGDIPAIEATNKTD